MLDIKSSIIEKILDYYFASPETRNYVRGLARVLGVDPGNLTRALKSLEREGVLMSEQEANLLYYQLNKSYPLMKEFKKIYEAKYGIEKKLSLVLNKLPKLESAYIFGSYAKGKGFGPESDIDILLIGNHSSLEARRLLVGIEKKIGREINAVNMTPKELFRKKSEKNEFVLNIFKGKMLKIV